MPQFTKFKLEYFILWDGGVNNIEVMPLFPITSHVEMDDDMNNIVSKLSSRENISSYLLRLLAMIHKHAAYILTLAQFMALCILIIVNMIKESREKIFFTTQEQSRI